MKSLFALQFLATTALARTEVMLPLYSSPIDGNLNLATSLDWQAAIDTINFHRDLHFYVIINPANGPSKTSYPDDPTIGAKCNIEHGCNKDWTYNIAKINALENAQTLGYIYTRYGDTSRRSIDDIETDIAEYANWTTAPTWDNLNGNITMHGLFFDETATEPEHLAEYRDLVNFANQSFATPDRGLYSVVLNPGTNLSPMNNYETDMFSLVTAVVTRETCWVPVGSDSVDCPGNYTPFDYASLSSGNGLPSNPALNPQAVVIVHQFHDATGGRPATNETLLEQLRGIVGLGLHSTYFTSGSWQNQTVPPADVGNFADLLSRANNDTATAGRL
ncbi:Spherulation-specific family 4 [Pseudomassariella vexata]|uniref:Spherulation-specific family 4 n=1 Tax=Pseudomassariella vexata TaxID=1141098 RepID=A0A1Y2E5H2_9PEZI|nr:Spherulation-specific family 4 [Pseudomassariella vexata]ORY66536.1 Spherulation-specific family 4 [Pseudomassariella vexata]